MRGRQALGTYLIFSQPGRLRWAGRDSRSRAGSVVTGQRLAQPGRPW